MPAEAGLGGHPPDAAPDVRLWERALVAILLGLAALAWLITAGHAEPGMRSGLLTGGAAPMGSMSGMYMPTLVALGLFLGVWLVMMAAMMLPALTPVVLTFDRWARRTDRGRTASAFFVGGYLLVWGATGLLVFGGGVFVAPLLPAGDTGVRLGAGLLVVAGAYQFTPLKSRCLQHCRSPLAFLAHHAAQLRAGHLAATRVGAVHGVFCVGCCWALMLVLILLGMMSLVWMGAVAGVILLEKVMPRRWAVGPLVGLLLLGLGGALLAWPTLLIP